MPGDSPVGKEEVIYLVDDNGTIIHILFIHIADDNGLRHTIYDF